jgi:tetratricopeptide (TPR) repeat protein
MHRSNTLVAHVLVATLLLAALPDRVAPPAHAQSTEERAKDLVREGNRLYKQHQFEPALRRYQEAFALRPTPITVFNMGQCLRELGQLGPAVFQFRIFLAMAPTAPNAAQVRELIAELERTAAAQRAPTGNGAPVVLAPSVLPSPPSAQAEPVVVTAADGGSAPGRPWYKRWYVWVPIAVLVAGGVVGGAVAGSRAGGGPAPPMADLGTQPFFNRR